MTVNTIVRIALLGTAMFVAPNAWAADSSSQTFITNAIQGNFAEISAGELAQQHGTTDAIKAFGKTLVADHTKANQDAMAVAKDMGVTAPTEPNAEQKAMHDRLAGETGMAFDKDFLSGMAMDHAKDAAAYQVASTDDKDAAGDYAGKTLPVIKAHLATAQKLAGDETMGASTMAAGAAMGLEAGANSFTEGQAKGRIEKAGYSDVGDLKKDDQGIWRGTAKKNGQAMPVGVDFKGNVAGK